MRITLSPSTSLAPGSLATRIFWRVATLMMAVAVMVASFDAAYAAKKRKHSGSTHTEQTAPPSGGTQAPSGPPDPGSYK